jgi:hypothetical protein
MARLGRRLDGAALRRLVIPLLLATVPAAGAAQPDSDLFQKIPEIRGAGPGRPAIAPDQQSPAEVVTLDPGLVPLFLELPPESEVKVADWPIAPQVRADVVLRRHEIYAPEARIFKVIGSKLVEVPRSSQVFYWGEAEVDGDVRVFVAVDPATGELKGFASSVDGIQELRPRPQRPGRARRHLVAPAESFAAAAAKDQGDLSWTCGQAELPRDLAKASAPSQLGFFGAAAISSLHTATVAVDTDNELMSVKFANDTTSATNYVANLIAAMNVMYERDLLVRLVQGTTFLRVSTDPYASPAGGFADSNKLNEFTNYWRANYGNVSRALAMMLSGKGSSGASGIAWLNGLCSTNAGYSFTQVFRSAGDTSASDARIVGHELGHNFGSDHTHCYSPPIDTCYGSEPGCYAGGTSCPAAAAINGVSNVRGTVMSYCHLLGGCSAASVFHPRTVTLLQPIIQSKVGQCVFPAVTGPTVSAIGPNSGSTSGGTAVTIRGTNFQAGATVTIGGVAATAVNVVNATTLTAVTGPHATGTVSVSVTNPDALSGTLSNSYFYAPPPSPTGFYTLTPCRVVDTRNPNGPRGGPALAASSVRTFPITGVCGIPASARSVSFNVTVVTPAAAGHLGTFPGNAMPLGTSTVSFTAGRIRASSAVLLLATDGAGTLGVQNGSAGAVHLILDVNGYFQ